MSEFPVNVPLITGINAKPEAYTPEHSPEEAVITSFIQEKMLPAAPRPKSGPLLQLIIGFSGEKSFQVQCPEENSHKNLHEIG